MENATVLSVIVVEDSRYFADLTLRLLKRSGLKLKSRIVSTRSALQEALKEDRYDIILSDNVMPDFDALSALEIKNDMCRDIPFIIVSEDVSQQDLEEAFRKGCDSYLPKDRIADLPQIVRQVLSTSDPRA
ncbi:MAG: response regulator [Clostridiaceae bacterium]|nr:response regulator [Clostridiaceae bacterium]